MEMTWTLWFEVGLWFKPSPMRISCWMRLMPTTGWSRKAMRSLSVSLVSDQWEFMVDVMKLEDFCRAKWFENKLVRWSFCAVTQNVLGFIAAQVPVVAVNLHECREISRWRWIVMYRSFASWSLVVPSLMCFVPRNEKRVMTFLYLSFLASPHVLCVVVSR